MILRLNKIVSISAVLIFLCSCSRVNNRKAEQSLLVPETKIEYSGRPVKVIEAEPSVKTPEKKQVSSDLSGPDIDLTVMSATMIYSTVFQFLIDWESYEGKIIRIRGIYTPFFRQETNRLYHNVVIQDATACCKEGLEFVWEDGTHPGNDYPDEGSEIIVQGVFEQYYEDDKMEVMQIRLRDASMEVVQE